MIEPLLLFFTSPEEESAIFATLKAFNHLQTNSGTAATTPPKIEVDEVPYECMRTNRA
jgi:hypothetical protein